MDKETVPIIEVGIVNSQRIRFSLEGRYRLAGRREFLSGNAEVYLKHGRIKITQNRKIYDADDSVILEPEEKTKGRFIIREVMIGIGFHWEQKEDQEFRGALKLAVSGNGIQVVNLISVEEYLISVISSEMSGENSIELLKAHTIISRSWVLAQIAKKDILTEENKPYQPIYISDEEYIRWYDREDHDEFHVCADDHCQRYQGINRAYHPEVVKAVKETAGKVLMYEGLICDARYSKCCGGVVEKFEYCWEPVLHPYLQRVDDNPKSMQVNSDDLKIESNAIQYIKGTPRAFCNTNDISLLRQVLNDYDQNSKDFFRWKVTYTQEELSRLILKKSGIDFGEIIDLEPIERGESGRLVRLKIVGTMKTLTIGKELEIRRWLSDSHLYSAAFVVEKQKISNGIPGQFILLGAGWGHGVGLCQIGAAVMAHMGYSHEEILSHYFIDVTIEKRYE